MYGHGEVLSSVTPDQQHITSKNKRKKPSEASITVKESIQEPDKPSKRARKDRIPDVEKNCQ